MFALEWCEFCWALRKLFARYGIAYRSVDLDSVEYQKDDRGGKIRAALARTTGATTIPQVFVAGELIGGCTETLDAMKSGRLPALLRKSGVKFDESASADPYSFLPGWLAVTSILGIRAIRAASQDHCGFITFPTMPATSP